jgi:hypothetical protein
MRDAIKTYGCHDCASIHRKYTTLVECMFRSQRPMWVTGADGEYATLSYCQGLPRAHNPATRDDQTGAGCPGPDRQTRLWGWLPQRPPAHPADRALNGAAMRGDSPAI